MSTCPARLIVAGAFTYRTTPCAYMAEHSGDHLFADGDQSDAIRLKNAQDVRDREIARLKAELADHGAPRCACGNHARYLDARGVLTCSLCPLKAGVRSWRLTDIPALLTKAQP